MSYGQTKSGKPNSFSQRHALRKVALTLACGLWISTAVGCFDSFDMRKNIPWPELINYDEPKVPLKMVTIWQNTVKETQGKAPVRGFGGLVVFYGKDGMTPVKVDGQFEVFAFVETGNEAEDATPDRKFVFTAEQVAKHYSEKDIGHTYSFWLPWEAVGGESMQITLAARFRPSVGGGTVFSEHSRTLLPGFDSPERQFADRPVGPTSSYVDVTPIGYFSEQRDAARRVPDMRVQPRTIQMPNLNATSAIRRGMSNGALPNNGSPNNMSPGAAPYYNMLYGQQQYAAQPGNFQPYGSQPYQDAGVIQAQAQIPNNNGAPAGLQIQQRTFYQGAPAHMGTYEQERAQAITTGARQNSSLNNVSLSGAGRWGRYRNSGNLVGPGTDVTVGSDAARRLAQGPRQTSLQQAMSQQTMNQNSGAFQGSTSGGWTTYSSTGSLVPQQPASGLQPPRLPAQGGPLAPQGLGQQQWQPALQGQLSNPRFER